MARPHPHKRAARLAAISILSVLGAVAAIWAAPRVSDAVAAWMSTPPVELRSAALPSALPVGPASLAGARAAAQPDAATIDAGMRFTMAGVTCAPPRGPGAVDVLLRTSEDGQTWSRWYTVALERVAENGGEEKAFTEPVWTGSGRYLQVGARQAGDAGTAPARLRDVRVVAINSTEDADRASAVVGVIRRAAATVAGFRLTQTAAAMTSKPHIVTRSEWGANESWRSGSPDYASVKMAFVHHTDSGNDYSAAEAPAIMRGVYAYHTKSLHWSDVGYNFLIDRYGTIYEGRYGGVTRGVIGAQVLGFNTGSTGISVIGTFTSATPPSRAVVSLERLLEWKLDVHHVDPQGTGTLICGYGQKFGTGQHVKFPAIAGHRDANFTDCPGGRLYVQLPNVRKVVARTGQPKIYGFIVEDPAISPNGDGVHDSATIGFTISQTATWRLEIRDDAGKLVRTRAARARSSRPPGPAATTTATGSPTACTRCRSTPRAPTARRARPRRPCGSTRSRRASRAPASRPTRSARTATGRTTTPCSRSCRARPVRRGCPSSPTTERPAPRHRMEGRDDVRAEGPVGRPHLVRLGSERRRPRARPPCCSSSATAPATPRAPGARSRWTGR